MANLTVYLSEVPNPLGRTGVVCAAGVSATTSRVPLAIVCERTMANATYISIMRRTTTADNYLQISEVRPLRLGAIHPTHIHTM